jgi:hypothetical protein
MSIDAAFGFQSQSTRALASIDSTKYPDTNKDIQQNLIRLNQFVDYIASYLQVMQKGIDKNTNDPIAQIQGTVSDIAVLLGGGELLYGIDLGDLQYFLPAIGALLGFDGTTPFPINLFNAAEHFLLGYVVPLDSFGVVIEGIIDGWAVALGIDPAWIQAINDLLDAFSNLAIDIQDFLNELEKLLNILGPMSGFGSLWNAVTTLLGGFSLDQLGSIIDPAFKAVAPWIEELAVAVNQLDAVLKAFTAGVVDVQGILNFSQLFTPFTNFFPTIPSDFNITTALTQWITGALQPSGLLAPLVSDPAAGLGLVGFVPLENLAMEAIAAVVGGAQGLIDAILGVFGYAPGTGTADDVAQIFTNIYDFLGNPTNFTTDIFNVATAVENFITTMINPTNLLAPLSGGVVPPINIPGLDASKIITGIFGMPQMPAGLLNTTSPLNAQYLFNQVPSQLLGMLPYSHIGSANPNLLTSAGFDSVASVLSNPGWGWDGADGHTTPGSAIAVANGSLLTLVSNNIQVTQGQLMNLSVWVKYIGLTATALSNPLRMAVAQYQGTTAGAQTMVASIPSPTGSSAGFVQMSGNYTVPAGVDNIVVLLQVMSTATAGTVKYDDAYAGKNGLMSGNWMSGISGTVASDIQSAVDQIFQATQGGASTGNALSTIKNSLLNIPGPNIVTSLLAGVIPGLDATKIVTGAMALARIPNLPTSQITSGIFGAGFIPGLDVSKIVTGVFGTGFIPGLDVSKIISGVFGAGFIPSLDASKIVSGILGIAQIPTNLLNKSNITDLGTLNDSVTNAFQGLSNIGSPFNAPQNNLIGTTVVQSTGTMNAIYNHVIDAVNSIQALRSQNTATSISGISVNVNFSDYPDGPLPSTFTVTYSGAGTSTVTVKGGAAGFNNLVNDANRTAYVVWNQGPTNSDYQIVRGTMASAPGGSVSGGQPAIYAMGRVDNPGNPRNYVWARAYCTGFLTYKADVGCTVNGVDNIFSSGIALTWSLDIAVVIGANATPRRYQAYSGTSLVFDYTEAGTTSQVGAGFRYWGCRTEMKQGSGGAGSPGTIAATSVSDNAPPNVLGSTFRICRKSTTTVAVANSGAGNPVKVAANFFDTLEWMSPDMTWDGQNLTVNTEGTYLAVLRYNTGNIPTNTKFTPVIFQNNAAEAMVDGGFADSYGGQAMGGVGGGALVYCHVGDIFSAGTASSGAGTITGDAGGYSCYFEMALVNRSMT